ncbi:MAG: 3-deoxy-manno-octulosonate cytidylyltransferase [Sandaracinaceae bacterium]
MTRCHDVVPARYPSERQPGKPLSHHGGAPMVVRCMQVAQRAGAERVLAAVDDARIAEAVEQAGFVAVMTSPDHASGTDRLAEVAAKEGFGDEDIVVNLQGDEPLVPPALLSALASALELHPRTGIATMATPIREAASLFTESVVKVVTDDAGFALTFSRAPIPWVRGVFPTESLPDGVPFLRHLGLYAYRASTLRQVSAAPQAAIEKAESLEQLRALAMGIRIHVTVLDEAPPHGVDTPEDLERVRSLLA